ncbi:PRTRC system protein B [Spirosoma sp.]|uniref:PRTRC system protein B n=1 Tax=Spirosoma sp. TaxID=1899569 RepID=UPI00260A0E67|nr:PRTRC system protein B [Spirosoma sp.]MCX6217654.1 PRTRC system protein B [Spirosoma sp.]
MQNITHLFSKTYSPVQALVLMRLNDPDKQSYYVESHDIDPQTGKPINAHPLSHEEAKALSETLYQPPKKTAKKGKQPPKAPFHCAGLFPENVLYFNTDKSDTVVWYTPAKEQPLFFSKSLEIDNGKGQVPALLWIATRKSLRLFALKSNKRPTAKSQLYYAPFFNTSSDGHVCMGNVQKDFAGDVSLTQFMDQWEHYFFNSYFTHASAILTKTNIVQLWKEQVATPRPFPVSALLETKTTLAQLLQ